MPQTVNPKSIYPTFANYSHGVLTNGETLFVSGQLGIDASGNVPESVLEQARLCFANVQAILADAGFQVKDVARINAFVKSETALGDYMKARDEWIAALQDPPASTLVIVSGFTRPEFMVEVEVTACIEMVNQ